MENHDVEDETQERILWRQQAKKRVLSNLLPANELYDDLKSAERAGARGCEDLLSSGGRQKCAKEHCESSVERKRVAWIVLGICASGRS